MAEIDFKTVRDLREETSAGIGLCKEALEKSRGDKEKAMEYIRKKGAAKSEKRSDRTTAEGVIGVYHHGVDERVAALVEINCETDFVARNEDFRKLAHELAMQVAAMKAQWVNRDSVPSEIVEKEKEIIMESDDLTDKTKEMKEKITQGKMMKFYEENCLLEQKYFKNEDLTIQDLLDEAVAKIGEKIIVSRIYRMEVGG